jgi:prepilin-type N-terminal cleavage/methylation domain-containing protein
MRRRQAGYTLTEVLTVLAIVGVMAAVTIPAFFNYMRINRAKTSLRNLISDVRTARAISVKTGHQIKVVFLPTPLASSTPDLQGCSKCSRTYDYYEGDRAFLSANWTPITGPLSNPHKPSRSLDTSMYFPADSATTPQDFTVDPTAGTNGIPNGALEIVFYPDGHMDLPNVSQASSYSSTPVDYKTNLTSPPAGGITIQTNPQTPVIKYTLIISASGRIKTL